MNFTKEAFRYVNRAVIRDVISEFSSKDVANIGIALASKGRDNGIGSLTLIERLAIIGAAETQAIGPEVAADATKASQDAKEAQNN